MNLKNVLEAQTFMNKELGIGARHITISTVGVPNTLARLAAAKLQSILAVSLHAPNQKLREEIIPTAGSYPLEAIMQDCAAYFQQTGRRVSFEYVLLNEVNDEVEHANELARLLRRHRAMQVRAAARPPARTGGIPQRADTPRCPSLPQLAEPRQPDSLQRDRGGAVPKAEPQSRQAVREGSPGARDQDEHPGAAGRRGPSRLRAAPQRVPEEPAAGTDQ